MTEAFDVLLRGGDVVDGTGTTARRADVGIRGDRIDAVGDLSAATATSVVDVTGSVVTPGFIDTHAHTDFVPLLAGLSDEVRLASIRQGVTTEVCGNCGFTPGPISGLRSGEVDRHLDVLVGELRTEDTPIAFDNFAGYRKTLAERDLVANLAPLVGHGTLRVAAMGFDRRPATNDEVAAMSASLDTALDQGAFGVSSGLIYPPGVFAETEELIALARVAARHGLPYATHMRDEMDNVEDAVAEAIRIGRESGAAVQISHHKVAGRANWGRHDATLAAIERARAGGLDVTTDAYPYTAGSTALYAVLPPWVWEGGPNAMLPRLRDTATRERIRTEFAVGIPGWQNMLSSTGWDQVVIASSATADLEGQSIAEIGAASGRDPVDVVCDLLVAEDGAPLIIIHMMAEDDVQSIISQPYTMIGSDGVPLPGKQHPRLAGAFARVLGAAARAADNAELPDLVRRMTSLPAAKFGLAGRGLIAPGSVADVVVLDVATVNDQATYADPLLPPLGIQHVFVAGVHVVRDGQDTGRRAGQVLAPSR